ncbi:MAG TPA: hypothetical protein VKV06_08890 [Acidimicrobiales bacterium]|nr:hypothetical protein [Acidimicrobiales bacterium]
MNPLQLEVIATQQHALDLARAQTRRDAAGRSLQPAFGERLGRLLVGAGSRLIAHGER